MGLCSEKMKVHQYKYVVLPCSANQKSYDAGVHMIMSSSSNVWKL